MIHRQGDVGKFRVAIAGATGRVGGALLASLANDPIEIVALTRSASSIATSANLLAAEINFDDQSTLVDAMEGADRLFLSHGTSDRQVANEIALIDAAITAGVPHVVKLSAMGPPSHLHPFDWHMHIEAHLAGQEIGYTVLRPTTFMDVLARAKASIAQGSWGGTAGDGLVNMIDTRDVAEVARITLLDDRSPASQRAYHLTGPTCVSMPQVAEELSRILGRIVTYQRRTNDEHRTQLIKSGLSEMAADISLGLDRIFREEALAETTTTILDLTGKLPRNVADWLREHFDGFAP